MKENRLKKEQSKSEQAALAVAQQQAQASAVAAAAAEAEAASNPLKILESFRSKIAHLDKDVNLKPKRMQFKKLVNLSLNTLSKDSLTILKSSKDLLSGLTALSGLEKDYLIDLILASIFKRLRASTYSKLKNDGFQLASCSSLILSKDERFKDVLEFYGMAESPFWEGNHPKSAEEGDMRMLEKVRSFLRSERERAANTINYERQFVVARVAFSMTYRAPATPTTQF